MQFFKKNRNKIMVITVTIILIIIMGLTNASRKSISKPEDLVGGIFTPINKFFYNIGNKTSNFFTSITNVSSLKSENDRLKKENAGLKDKTRKYENVIGKKDYLKAEYALLNKDKYKLIEGQITGKESGKWFDRFTIDKGLNDGIKNGDTVIHAVESENASVTEGIVGRVIKVGNNWADVIAIVDESSKISFKSSRSQEGGMINGSINGKITGYLFDQDADVKVGDDVFTSGLGGVYKKDIYIGKIKSVQVKDEELMKTIEVEPAINFKKLYKVFIISGER